MKPSERLAIQDSILETKEQVRRIVEALLHAEGHGLTCECTVCEGIMEAYKAMEWTDSEARGLDDEDNEDDSDLTGYRRPGNWPGSPV